MSNLIGQSLGRYHILEQLGEGGMAIVYKAHDTRLERDVAIKVIRTNQFAPAVLERILKRFEREAKALARLSHPNIVKVHDYGEYKVTPYLVLEYLPAGTLKQRLGKPIPWQKAVQLIIPIAQALEYAHEHNIVHRDIKPSNILLTEKGQPMLTDFGIAKLLENEDTTTLTGTGLSVGTPEYMSPEQSMGKDVDGRADIYSLGIILYEMITGRKPYVGDTPMSVIIKQISEPLPSPRKYISDLPENIEKMLAKALAKLPDKRYSNASEFAEALEKVQAKPVRIPTPLRSNPAKQLVNESKTTSTQMDDEATVNQFENTDKIKVSATRKSSRKPNTNQIRLTLPLSDTVYIAAEGGIPLYTSFSETQWNIWLEHGEKLTIVESLENARDSMGKYGHYIQVIDKHGNKGFVPAKTINFENPLKRKQMR